jgi:hypothetical protein
MPLRDGEKGATEHQPVALVQRALELPVRPVYRALRYIVALDSIPCMRYLQLRGLCPATNYGTSSAEGRLHHHSIQGLSGLS